MIATNTTYSALGDCALACTGLFALKMLGGKMRFFQMSPIPIHAIALNSLIAAGGSLLGRVVYENLNTVEKPEEDENDESPNQNLIPLVGSIAFSLIGLNYVVGKYCPQLPLIKPHLIASVAALTPIVLFEIFQSFKEEVEESSEKPELEKREEVKGEEVKGEVKQKELEEAIYAKSEDDS